MAEDGSSPIRSRLDRAASWLVLAWVAGVGFAYAAAMLRARGLMP